MAIKEKEQNYTISGILKEDGVNEGKTVGRWEWWLWGSLMIPGNIGLSVWESGMLVPVPVRDEQNVLGAWCTPPPNQDDGMELS